MYLDLNCDLGEGSPHDAELMPLITSANVACNGHAGDLTAVVAALTLAKRHGVTVGAHPGYLDREHFGRREPNLPRDEIRGQVEAQLDFLREIAAGVGVAVRYLKPHGALYNTACRDRDLADLLVGIARRYGLPMMALPKSALQEACGDHPFIAEGFADRRYSDEGYLLPRTSPDAFVRTPEEALAQAKTLLASHGVASLCVHGDNPEAVAFARAMREGLAAAGVTLRSAVPA